ncbi:MAG: hypothetical protein RR387_01170, partial [Clostridiales bacterium]
MKKKLLGVLLVLTITLLCSATALATETSYSVAYNGAHGAITTNTATITPGTAYATTLTPAAGYDRPDKLTATMGNNSADFTGFDYTAATGTITISQASTVTGNIVFSGNCPAQSYAVGFNSPGKHITNTGRNTATFGQDYTATLSTDDGYYVGTIAITRGGETLSNNDYTFKAATGQLTIQASAITGDITITATSVAFDVSMEIKGDDNVNYLKANKFDPSEGKYNLDIDADVNQLDLTIYFDPGEYDVTVKYDGKNIKYTDKDKKDQYYAYEISIDQDDLATLAVT